MQIDSILANIDSNTINANKVKTIVIQGLVKENIITIEQAGNFCENYSVIISKRSWWQRMTQKEDDEKLSYLLVKHIIGDIDEKNNLEDLKK
jgi:hypothetical protein